MLRPSGASGFPAYNWWNEALHGVARAGRATVFPQAIGLAATFDTDLIGRVATAISDEARAKHHESVRQGRRGIYEGLTFWSPNINIFRDPRWGRGMETYGEDPYLTGELAVAFVRGMQGDDPRYLKTVATPKHFAVHSGPEPDRHTFDARVSETDLRETYLPAFRASVIKGGAESVMCAYNRFRGTPACASQELLGTILRDVWGFSGYVVSDCWAIMDIYNTHRVAPTQVEAAAMSLAAGTDLNCGVSFGSLGEAVRSGRVSEDALNQAVRRLFRVRFRLGMFDPPERVPWSAIPYGVIDSEEHRALALETARKSIVLLRNEGGVLPLPKDLETLAVIGPNANDVDVLLGNYNGTPSHPVTPLEGLRKKVGPGTRVLYARGSDVADLLPSLVTVPMAALRPSGPPAPGSDRSGPRAGGLTGEYFAHRDFMGEPVATRVDTVLDFNWWDQAPLEGVPKDSFSVRWSGVLLPPRSGDYSLGVRVFGGVRLFVDDSLLVEHSDRHVVTAQWASIHLEAGEPHALRVEYQTERSDALVQLLWAPPEPGLREEALRAAEAADAVVMVLGLSPRLEGEEMPVRIPGFSGGDRTSLDLPPTQQKLLEDILSTGKPVVLVLLNGSALGLRWASEHVPAIVEAWYLGQAAGTALADVLFGDYDPAGRLPVTFYSSVDDLPPFDDYAMAGRTYRYFAGDPVFPFGYGLSYARFAYASLDLPARVKAGDSVRIAVDVENTGAVPGEEVVQLYVSDLEATAPVPFRSLQSFRRIFLSPGERTTVTFSLDARQLSLIDGDGNRIVEPGWFEVSIGGRQPDAPASLDLSTTQMVTGRLEVVGTRFILPG